MSRRYLYKLADELRAESGYVLTDVFVLNTATWGRKNFESAKKNLRIQKSQNTAGVVLRHARVYFKPFRDVPTRRRPTAVVPFVNGC